MPLWRRECGAIPVVQGGKRTNRAPGRGQPEPERTNNMTTIIINNSILANGDLAQMAFEAVEANGMEGGLWAIRIDQYAMFDCSFMAREYKPGWHNAIVSVDIAPKPEPKHKTSGLAEGNPRETVLSEPNSLDSVGQTGSGVLPVVGEGTPAPQRQEQSTPDGEGMQGKSIVVGSRWRYLGHQQADTVIEANDGEIVTENANRTAEHGWLRDEFLRLHAPV